MRQNIDRVARYCIVTLPRSGSNYLASRIEAQPDFSYQSELFHRRSIYYGLRWASRLNVLYFNPLVLVRDAAPFRFIEWRLRQATAENPATVAFGFKMFVYHNPRVLRAIVDDGRWRIVFLHRDNKLAQYGSHKLARRTRAWVNFGAHGSAARQVVFDADEFDRYCARMQGYEEEAREMMRDRPWLDLEYEDIDRRIGEVVAWIRGDNDGGGAEARRPTAKQHRGSDLDRFANPEAVRRHLAGTPLASYAGLAPESEGNGDRHA